MLKLVRFQKKDLLKSSNCEEVICSSRQMFASERKNRNNLGALADIPVYSITYTQIKKIAALKNQILNIHLLTALK